MARHCGVQNFVKDSKRKRREGWGHQLLLENVDKTHLKNEQSKYNQFVKDWNMLANRSEQDKAIETRVSRKGLQNIHPEDFDIQNKAKKFRLQKLKLIPLQGQLILDAGCGPGTYGLILAQEGNEVVGIDISLDAIKVAKERARRKQVNATFTPILADLENLPLRDNIFDLCFVGWTLHHFPSLKAVNGLAKVLIDGGRIALTEPNELHPALKLSRHAENLFKGLLRETGLYTENVSVHTYKDYYKNLKNNGFTITMLTSCYAKEPIIIPRGIKFLKKTLLHFSSLYAIFSAHS